MNREKNNRVVIASVLKPVDDTRMFGKIGVSLHEHGYDIHVIGFPSLGILQDQPKTYPLPYFKRLSWRRLTAPAYVLKMILQLKPALLIITTHELLFVALLAKAMTGMRVIYDVQENYFFNIIHTDSFPRLIKPFVAFYVRIKETLIAPFVDYFFLAEKAYAKELPFIKKKYVVLENKLRRGNHKRIHQHEKSEDIKLVFTGTLSESTGVFEAIKLAIKLHQQEPKVRLTIIGYCAVPDTLAKLKATVSQFHFIELIGGETLVPHADILDYIARADFGIISYPPNKSTYTAIPTKLYEYLGMELPILLIEHPSWVELCEAYDSAIPFNSSTDPQQILKVMFTKQFYPNKPHNVFWESEEQKLLQSIRSLFSK